MGLALFDKKSNAKYASRFAAEEEKARKMHLNVWRYGDIGAEEDDEDFPSLSHKYIYIYIYIIYIYYYI